MKRILLSDGVIRGAFSRATAVSARSNFGSGSLRAASVWSFGDNSSGALGSSSPLVDAYEPSKVPELPSTITAVAAGHYHSLAVNADGEVWAWGRNEEGQLGRGNDAPRYTWCKPERVLGFNDVKVKAAYASGVVSAAVGDDGSLWVWGRSKRGQLGLGKGVTEAMKPSKVEALSGQEISKVSFGWGHAFASTRDGKLFGWGYAESGRLGKMGEALLNTNSQYPNSYDSLDNSVSMLKVADKLATENNREKINWDPSLILELSSIEVSDVACGLDHSLILCCDGTVLSCGDNTYGQLGRETDGSKILPVPINFLPLSLSAGLGHSLLLHHIPTDSEESPAGILSWGWNRSSQLGRKGQENAPAPVEGLEGLEGLEGEVLVSVSAGRVHSLCLTSKGQVWTWGSGRNGRLGLGSSADETEPTSVQSLEGLRVLQAVAGFDHNLLVVDD